MITTCTWISEKLKEAWSFRWLFTIIYISIMYINTPLAFKGSIQCIAQLWCARKELECSASCLIAIPKNSSCHNKYIMCIMLRLPNVFSNWSAMVFTCVLHVHLCALVFESCKRKKNLHRNKRVLFAIEWFDIAGIYKI